jgi:dTDP-4-amino-4,6-dideoxygalactose transaminase
VPAWQWAEHWVILKCLFTGKLIEGTCKEQLYALVRKKTGMKYVFGFNSGQEAIYVALKASGIGPNDRVILPSYCCETVATAVLDSGAAPLFCDINDDYNPDVEHILKLIDDRVKSIIVSHLFGNPAAIDELEKALENRGIRSKILLIDDAAQSFGALLHGRLLGTFGDAGIISFGPGKTMTASGGGLLITNSKDLTKNLTKITTCRISFFDKLKHLLYWIIFRRWRKFTLPFFPSLSKYFKSSAKDKGKVGTLCNVDAAIAVEQFKKLDSLLETRIKRKEILDNNLAEYDRGIFYLLPKNISKNVSLNVATKYLVRLNTIECNPDILSIYKYIVEGSGIEIQSLYTPIHMKPEYSDSRTSLPKTERCYNRIFQIPVEPSISKRDFKFILDRFSSFTNTLLTSASKN